MYIAKIFITLKDTVNDPQGHTIGTGLKDMGYDTVNSVRAGKYMEIGLDEPNATAAASQVESICENLLANPVIEQYSYELTQLN